MNIRADEYKKMIKFAEKLNMPYFILDTEEKSISEIVSEIERKVNIKSRREFENKER